MFEALDQLTGQWGKMGATHYMQAGSSAGGRLQKHYHGSSTVNKLGDAKQKSDSVHRDAMDPPNRNGSWIPWEGKNGTKGKTYKESPLIDGE